MPLFDGILPKQGYKLWIFVAVFFVELLLFQPAFSSDPVTVNYADSTGNKVYSNGTITWGQIPGANIQYKTNNAFDEGSLAQFYRYVKSFLASIAGEPFPFALLSGILDGEFDIAQNYMTLLKYGAGYVVCLVFGLLYAIFVPICGCCFSCCRCCGKCGGNYIEKYHPKSQEKRMGFGLVLLLLLILMGASVACTFLTNDRVGESINAVKTSIETNLDDINTYLNTTGEQFLYVAVDMFGVVSSGINKDFDDIGSLVGDPVVADILILVGPAINGILVLDTKLLNILNTVNTVESQIETVKSSGQALETILNSLASNITTTKGSCAAGSCATACNAIDESGLNVEVDFSQFPNLTSLSSTLSDIVDANLTAKVQQGQQLIYDIPEIITNETSSTKETVKSTLDGFADQIKGMVDSFLDLATNTVDINLYKGEVNTYIDMVGEYDQIRSQAGLGLMVPVALVMFILLGALCCGVFGYRKRVLPTERSGLSNCGGCVLLLAVFCMVFFGTILMILCFIIFLIGATMEKVCQPLIDLSVLQFIDSGGIPGFNLGELLLGNATLALSLSNILLGCRANEAPFKLMSLNALIPLEDYMDYKKYMPNIDTQFDDLGNIDMSNIAFLTPELLQTMDDFKNTGVNNVNFTEFQIILGNDILGFDIDAIINATQEVYDNCGTDDWLYHKAALENIRDVNIPGIETQLQALNATLTQLEFYAGSILSDVDNAVLQANLSQTALQNNASYLILDSIYSYKDRILNYIEQFKTEALYLVYNDVAACLPIWNAFDSVTVVMCNYAVGTLNAFWFGLGWGLVLFLPSIIFSIKLSKHYRRMNKCTGFSEKKEEKNSCKELSKLDSGDDELWYEMNEKKEKRY